MGRGKWKRGCMNSDLREVERDEGKGEEEEAEVSGVPQRKRLWRRGR